jgi:hypothetical protein
MARKRYSEIRLKIDEKSVLLQLELPIGFPKKIIIVFFIAILIYFNPDLRDAIQVALTFIK